MQAFARVFHLELRQFPHNVCRFNLSEGELRAIVEPWAREQVVEVGERKWSPHTARLTILQGPHLDVGQLAMGRGWRNAQRQSEDVTERVVAAAGEAGDGPGAGAALAVETPAPTVAATDALAVAAVLPSGDPAQAAPAGGSLGSDPFALGVRMAALLGPDAMRLLDAWRTAAAESPGLAPSETLALAERAVRSGDATAG